MDGQRSACVPTSPMTTTSSAHHTRLVMLAFAVVGGALGVVVHGNGITVGSRGGFVSWMLGPVVGAAAAACVGHLLATVGEPRRRRVAAIGASATIGLAIGLLIREEYHPRLDPPAIVVATVAFAAVGAGVAARRRRRLLEGALTGGVVGWLLGAWGSADLGGGTIASSIIACLLPALAIGLRLSTTSKPDDGSGALVERRFRAALFVGPAVLFVVATLLVPLARTVHLSLLDRNADAWVGLENYGDVLGDRESFDASGWTDLFTSFPFRAAVVLLATASLTGGVVKRRTGRAIEIGNPTFWPLVIGLLLLAFGVFTALRGMLVNNLWWVVVVTCCSTALGLLAAVLARGRRSGRIATAAVVMPVAVSLVGASVAWRFVYQARDASAEQTGVVNAAWVGLGRLSTGSGLPTIVTALVAGLASTTCLVLAARALLRRDWARAGIAGAATLLLGWFFVRFVGIVGDGIGGVAIADDGTATAQPVLFTEENPYNNAWLMVVLVWTQTGVAMIVSSAAIEAVPRELVEAARVDGATEHQVFWRVTFPQIAATIGVVVTTLVVVTVKVFDVVHVMTNGRFDTEVLANRMFLEAFREADTGTGAALAMLLLVLLLPAVYHRTRQSLAEA